MSSDAEECVGQVPDAIGVSRDKANMHIVPNVMLASDSAREEIRYLAGDLAVRIYRGYWPSIQAIHANLTARQWVEYQQYLVCQLCGRTCAGTCPGAKAQNP